MHSVLLVSSAGKTGSALGEFLRSCSYGRLTSVCSGGEARRLLPCSDFELIVINTPLPDEFGQELAMTAAESTASGVLLLVKSELADPLSEKVESCGVFVVPKPVSRQLFFQAVRLAAASRSRILGLQNRNLQLQEKIEEIRLVDRAKCALIQYLDMTEPQAHRYLEKQAMDMRCTRREIAEAVLRTYES